MALTAPTMCYAENCNESMQTMDEKLHMSSVTQQKVSTASIKIDQLITSSCLRRCPVVFDQAMPIRI
jgi:hypothetical protein